MSRANKNRPKRHPTKPDRAGGKWGRRMEQIRDALLGERAPLPDWMTDPSKLPKAPPGRAP